MQRTLPRIVEAGYFSLFLLPHVPTQLVAPRAVTMAVATDAMICTMESMVASMDVLTTLYVATY